MQDFLASKKAGASSRARKGLVVRPNGRSADFIIPSFATGCQLGCTYCYVARHRPFGNPLETYTNLDAIWAAVRAHWQALPPKPPNQCDPVRWTYDIGESTDCLTPAVIDATRFFVERFLAETDAKPTFATKLANGPRVLPALEAPGRARVRVSLMPQPVASVVEVATAPIAARIASIDPLVAMGWEVHLNLSPVIAYKGWVADYEALCDQIRAGVSAEALRQLKAEVIFLTHHPKLHESNLGWRPEAEALLWTPQWQEAKTNQRGSEDVLRYRGVRVKPALVQAFREIMARRLPECPIRYIF